MYFLLLPGLTLFSHIKLLVCNVLVKLLTKNLHKLLQTQGKQI